MNCMSVSLKYKRWREEGVDEWVRTKLRIFGWYGSITVRLNKTLCDVYLKKFKSEKRGEGTGRWMSGDWVRIFAKTNTTHTGYYKHL